MAVRRLYEHQPESFAFTPENVAWAERQKAKYPEGRQASAVLALLWKAQEQQGGWLCEPAIRTVAEMLDMAYIRVLEVATFYTMFNLAPVGRHHVQLCGTTPCVLRGAEALKDVCRRTIGPVDHVSEDGILSWTEVECLGACANAPMVQINADYFEDLDAENLAHLLGELRAGRAVKPGSQTGRATSAPAGGPTTLTDPSLYDGSMVGAWRRRFEGKDDAAGAPEARGRPDPEPRGEQQAAHHPAARASEGKQPIKPADQAEASPPAAGTPSLRGDPAAAKAGRSAQGSGLRATSKRTRAKAPEKGGTAKPANDTPPEQEEKK